MKYESTKGTKEYSGSSFEDTLFSGWLKDGGLYVPESIPKISSETMKVWSHMTYKELSLEMMLLFIGEDFISRDELKDMITTSYKDFPSDVVQMKELDDGVFVAELFHGQTSSFKDIAMAISSALLNYALEKRNKHAIVYICTSGDTGSAVIQVVKGMERIEALVMFPGGDRINKLQRLLMTTVNEENIHNYSGDCANDPFDIFWNSFSGEILNKFPSVVVTSLNSLIFIRVLAQTVHLLYCYYQASTNLSPVKLVIPSGGCGHITSATMLQKMGFPISIVSAFNDKNLNTYNFLSGKEFLLNAPVSRSLSVAMDIQYATNVQRLLSMWTNNDCVTINTMMEDFNRGSTKLQPNLLTEIRKMIVPVRVSDEEVKDTMKKCYETKGYCLDPHTAVGFSLHYKEKEDIPTVYAGCASPVKFKETLTLVNIPLSPEHERYVNELYQKKEYFKELPKDQSQWKDFFMKEIGDIVQKWE